MGQAKEAYMKFKMYTLKTNTNADETQSKRKKHKLTKTDSRQLDNTDCESLNDSIKSNEESLN